MRTATAGNRPARPSGTASALRRAAFPERLPGGFSRRRRILVDTRYQMKTALIGVTGMALLVGLMCLILHRVSVQSSREILQVAPSLEGSLRARDVTQLVMLLAWGLLFIGGVFFVQILESRRTAGVILNVRRRLEELRSGRLHARVTLRKHDNFPELAGSFNEMAGVLRARTEGELATLGRLASQTSELLREEALGNREGTRRIAAALRQSLEDARRRKAELLEP
jgi:methyl-accepting chemotaxis protein